MNMNQEKETTGPGIVVLSSAMQVLHMNRRAMDLLTRLEHAAQRVVTERPLAAPLHQHCQDIIDTMQACLASNNWEQFHQDRTIGNSSHTIFLKGFGLPDRRGLPYSRIVMLLCPHTPESMPGISRMECTAPLSSGQSVEHCKLSFLQRIQSALSLHSLRNIQAHSLVTPVKDRRLSSAANGLE